MRPSKEPAETKEGAIVTDDPSREPVDVQPPLRGAVRGRRWRRGWSAAVVLIVFAMAAACSDDEPSAEEKACDAGSELRDALDQVAADVRAANFGDASRPA